jgi:hypothetical protein
MAELLRDTPEAGMTGGVLTHRPGEVTPRQELRIVIVTWIERTYHRRRSKRPSTD